MLQKQKLTFLRNSDIAIQKQSQIHVIVKSLRIYLPIIRQGQNLPTLVSPLVPPPPCIRSAGYISHITPSPPAQGGPCSARRMDHTEVCLFSTHREQTSTGESG